MKYITISDLSETIRKNIWKIPHDIDCVVGIPRSGMLVGSIISELLNVPLMDLNSFIVGMPYDGGGRLMFYNRNHNKTNKILIIDDTVYHGNSMNNAKMKLSKLKDKYNFIYSCVYLEGTGENTIDIYLEDVRDYAKDSFLKIVLYEWNIFHHYPPLMETCLYDIDGVFCLDPPDERNEQQYLEYINNAIPLFIPSLKIGGIITYRLVKNKEITEKWLHNNNVKYNEIFMFNANSYEERYNSGIPPEQYKGEFYRDNEKYQFFVESSDYQAKIISQISGKPVYCVETNKLYQ